MGEQVFCRVESLHRGESLAGTASTVRRWLLVEQSGPWGRDAVTQSRMGAEVGGELAALGRAAGARVLLIRRHGRYEQTGHRVFVAFTGRERRWLEEMHFADVDALLAHDFSPLRRGRSVGGGAVAGQRFFVCTHGKHDPCCARFGRPVAQALDDAMPELTWETSHIGGDRFAGNVLALPAGIYYGRLPPARAVAAMKALDAGRIDLAHFRGRTCLPFAAQAAEWFIRERLSLTGIDDLSLERHEQLAEDRTRSTFVRADGARVGADLAADRAPRARLTCHADGAAPAPAYRLLEIEEGG